MPPNRVHLQLQLRGIQSALTTSGDIPSQEHQRSPGLVRRLMGASLVALLGLSHNACDSDSAETSGEESENVAQTVVHTTAVPPESTLDVAGADDPTDPVPEDQKPVFDISYDTLMALADAGRGDPEAPSSAEDESNETAQRSSSAYTWNDINWGPATGSYTGKPNLYLPYPWGQARRAQTPHGSEDQSIDYFRPGISPEIVLPWSSIGTGTPYQWVYSSHEGKVAIYSSDTGKPCKVKVTWKTDTGGRIVTVYNHLEHVLVEDGEWVGPNEPIGRAATSDAQAECAGGSAVQIHQHESLVYSKTRNGYSKPVDLDKTVWSNNVVDHDWGVDYVCARGGYHWQEGHASGPEIKPCDEDLYNWECPSRGACADPNPTKAGWYVPKRKCYSSGGAETVLLNNDREGPELTGTSVADCAKRCAAVGRCKYFIVKDDKCYWQKTPEGYNWCHLQPYNSTQGTLYMRRGPVYMGQGVCANNSFSRLLPGRVSLEDCDAACWGNPSCKWMVYGIGNHGESGGCFMQNNGPNGCLDGNGQPGWVNHDWQLWDFTEK